MIYGFIIAAGKQSRFNSDIPKALSVVGDKTLLDINLSRLRRVCDRIFVVCSKENKDYFNGDYEKIVIKSGLGCGDAVLKAIGLLNIDDPKDTCFVQWGDSFVDSKLYKEMISQYNGKWVIPCELIDNPYVQIVPGDGRIKAVFSKYGEKTDRGLHDLSVFYGSMLKFKNMALLFRYNTFNGKVYNHKHGNEFQFLDIFNDTSLGAIAYETQYKGYSFNTVDELNDIVRKLGEDA